MNKQLAKRLVEIAQKKDSLEVAMTPRMEITLFAAWYFKEEGGIAGMDVADLIPGPASSVSRTIKALVKLGFATFESEAGADPRHKKLNLTEAGIAFADDIINSLQERREKFTL